MEQQVLTITGTTKYMCNWVRIHITVVREISLLRYFKWLRSCNSPTCPTSQHWRRRRRSTNVREQSSQFKVKPSKYYKCLFWLLLLLLPHAIVLLLCSEIIVMRSLSQLSYIIILCRFFNIYKQKRNVMTVCSFSFDSIVLSSIAVCCCCCCFDVLQRYKRTMVIIAQFGRTIKRSVVFPLPPWCCEPNE